MALKTEIYLGDSAEILKKIPDNTIDLIITSPPYADQRKNTYGGIHPNKYVEWFLPISEELLRVLKPSGTFILNIKEKVVNGERSTYVIELILSMRKQGWLWTEEFIWHKKNSFPGKWPNRFRDSWERLLHFNKDKHFNMYQDKVMVPMGDWAKTRLKKLSETDKIIEVGPGIGTLTREMGKVAENVVSIEIDKTLIPILKETLADLDNVEVVNEDILKVDVQGLIKEKLNGGPVKLVANLPYYITTPIVMKFLEEDIPVTDIVVMVQKEVADRMNAKPSTKDYGALSVAVQYYCDTEIVAKAPRHMFVPQPNVDSIVIGLHVRDEKKYVVDNEDIFFKTVKASFGQRRKTLLNSLGGFGFLSKDQIKEALKEANIDEKRRGETLSIDEFANLSNEINKFSSK